MLDLSRVGKIERCALFRQLSHVGAYILHLSSALLLFLLENPRRPETRQIAIEHTVVVVAVVGARRYAFNK